MGKKSWGLLITALVTFASPAQSATTFYTDRDAFEAAMTAFANEQFEDNAFVTGLGVTSDVGVVQDGMWYDRVTMDGDSTTWSFDTSVTAWGGDFDLSPVGNGQSLKFTLDGADELDMQLAVYEPTFYGFITDTSFSSLAIESGDRGGLAETYEMDNVTFGLAHPVAAVPLPAGLPLLIAAMGGLALVRRASPPKVQLG
jgi:hypothetical protein